MKHPIKPNFRLNADQVVDMPGHGLTTIKYLGRCPVSGTRLYDLPGASYPDHRARTFVAAEHGMRGPDLLASWLACNDSATFEKALALAKKKWVPSPETLGPVTSVNVAGVSWFDKVNGNPYFRATVYANGQKVATLRHQYGNPDQMQYVALDELHKAGYLVRNTGPSGMNETPQEWAKRTGNEFSVRHHKVSYREYNLERE